MFAISLPLIQVYFALAVGSADVLVLPPVPRVVPRAPGAVRHAVNRADRVIEFYIARSPGAAHQNPHAFVLRFTGGDAAGAATYTASRWGEHPVEVWVANYPGYGGSSGPRSLRNLARLALDAYDELRRTAGDRPIVVEGFSLGTVPALHVAASRPVAGVILQNAPPLRELIVERHGWWNVWLLASLVAARVPDELDSITNARRCAATRGVFLVADHDQTVPPGFQHQIIEAFAGERRVIVQRDADHVQALSADEQRELNDAMDWLLALDR